MEVRDIRQAYGLSRESAKNKAQNIFKLQTNTCEVYLVVSGEAWAREGQDYSDILGRLVLLGV